MSKTQTWGYRGAEAQIFDDPLPEGWADRPARGYHPHDVATGILPEPEKKPNSEPEDLQAIHRGRGSYSIMRGDTEVLDGLTKADAEAFNTLSAEDKAAFVEKA